MSTTQAELVLDARNGTGESPVWRVQEQALYWVDIPARKLCRYVPATGAVTEWLAPEMLGCAVPTGQPSQWLAGAESGVLRLELLADGKTNSTKVAPVAHA